MAKTVIGVFHDRNRAEEAINKLDGMGYNPKDISIVMRDHKEGEEFASDTGTNVAGGAVSGATAGGLIGALAGLLVGTGIVPGLGALLIAGPIAAALGLTGAVATTVSGAVTGAVAGGLIGALTGLGVSDEDAQMYEESVREGGILVMVPARTGYDYEVSDLMADYGATQVKTIDTGSMRERGEYERPVTKERDEYGAAYYSDVRRRSPLEEDEDLDLDEESDVELVPRESKPNSTRRTHSKRVRP
jgi:uncharacterized membrane protein